MNALDFCDAPSIDECAAVCAISGCDAEFEDMGDDRWAMKRPRGTNPAIERGDLEAIAAAAAAVASASRLGTAASKKPRSSRFRYGPHLAASCVTRSQCYPSPFWAAITSLRHAALGGIMAALSDDNVQVFIDTGVLAAGAAFMDCRWRGGRW